MKNNRRRVLGLVKQQQLFFTTTRKRRGYQTKLFINNEFVPSVSGKTFETLNPATGEKITDVYEADAADVDKAVEAATKAFKSWSTTSGFIRSKLLLRLADLIEKNAEELAKLESLDNGMPLQSHAKAVVLPGSVSYFRYYAGLADKIEGRMIPVDEKFFTVAKYEPVGVCGQIIPWNVPISMLAWKLAPALAAGCTVVLKSAEQTPLTALRVAELVAEAGFPAGVVNILSGDARCGKAIASHHGIDKLAFTGSKEVGRQVLQYAAASNMKRVSLELGGKSPQIIFNDADVDRAVSTVHSGIFYNAGQICSAGTRVYVQEEVYPQFLEKSVAMAKTKRVGDPLDPKTSQGPLVSQDQLDSVMRYIELGKQQGATLSCGGNAIRSKGYFVEPTIFSEVQDDMTIATEEIFGPVLAICKFKSADEVIERANKTEYGLAAGVHTKNISTALHVANRLKAGTVWVNTYNRMSPGQPFGGYKPGSGQGREGGIEGLKNYLEVKTIQVQLS